MDRVKGKVVLVMGVLKGLGEVDVCFLVLEGVMVIFVDVDVENGEWVVIDIGGLVCFVKYDV